MPQKRRRCRKKLIIDVGHPCEVHHYYWTARELRQKGWRCLFVAKDKDVIIELLRAYRLPFLVIAGNRGGVIRKLLQLPLDLWRFYCILCRFQPRLVISAVSVHAAWVSAFCRVPHIAFIDTEERRLLDLFTLAWVDWKVTAFSYRRDLGNHHLRYHGNHELAYLHPRRFHADETVLEELGIGRNQPFAVVRFVAWRALHDWGLARMSNSDRFALVKCLAQKRRVWISAEGELPVELERYRFPLPAHRLLHALAFADVYVGEGITMASEAVVLGTPAMLINPMWLGYCEEAARFGMLVYYERASEEMWKTLKKWSIAPALRPFFVEKHRALLTDKIDVSAFMAWLIDRYPESVRKIKERRFEERLFL